MGDPDRDSCGDYACKERRKGLEAELELLRELEDDVREEVDPEEVLAKLDVMRADAR